jgi:glycosyltransferase involved in cell wall biosynthesis
MILVYVPGLQGGVRNVTISLARAMQARGHEVVLVNSLFHLLSRSLRYLFHRGHRPKAILSLDSGVLSLFFARSVYILHGFPVKPLYGFLRSTSLKACALLAALGGSRLSAVSYLTRNVFQRIYGITVDLVIPNGVSPDFHSIPVAPLDKQKSVLYLGRLSYNKGVLELISAFLSSSLSSSGYKLLIAGSGPLQWEIQQAANVYDSVTYLGEVPEDAKIQLYIDSDIFVSLNDFEPFGVTAIEAAFTRCKTILAYGTGIADHFPVSGTLLKCDPLSCNSIICALEAASEMPTPPPLNDIEACQYDYKQIASAYLAALDELSSID